MSVKSAVVSYCVYPWRHSKASSARVSPVQHQESKIKPKHSQEKPRIIDALKHRNGHEQFMRTGCEGWKNNFLPQIQHGEILVAKAHSESSPTSLIPSCWSNIKTFEKIHYARRINELCLGQPEESFNKEHHDNLKLRIVLLIVATCWKQHPDFEELCLWPSLGSFYPRSIPIHNGTPTTRKLGYAETGLYEPGIKY